MAVTHATAVRNGLADYVVDQLDLGFVVFQSSGSVDLAILTFGNPAFGAAASGTATANAITADSNADATGVTTKAELRTSGSTALVLCSVTAIGGGGDITITNTSITAGDTVQMTSATYSAAA